MPKTFLSARPIISDTPAFFDTKDSKPEPIKTGESTGAYMGRVFKESMEKDLLGKNSLDAEMCAPGAMKRALEEACTGVGGFLQNIETEPDFYSSGLNTTNIRASIRVPVWEDGITDANRIGFTSSSLFQDGDHMYHFTKPTTITDYFPTRSITVDRPTELLSGRWQNISIGVQTSAIANSYNIDFETSTTGLLSQIYNGASPEHRIEQIKHIIKGAIRNNLLIRSNTRQRITHTSVTPQELKARQTLRDFITEKDWRRYITNGFVMTKGKSGKYYQIFADRSHTIVFENGKRIRELCIVTDYSCPPSDHVMTIKTMVELDEQSVWDGANKYNVRGKPMPQLMYKDDGNLLDQLARIA